jgi:O-antigen/teichoic acid export membrane protein
VTRHEKTSDRTVKKRRRTPFRLMRKAIRKGGWGIADQAFSSLTNFALAILVARVSSVKAFGIFTLLFTTYTLALVGCRAVVAQPLAVRFSDRDHDRWAEAVRTGLGAAIALGAAVGVLCFAAATFFGGTTTQNLIVLGIAMPFLLLQDNWRFAFFTAGRGSQAFLNDLVWAAIMFPAVAIALYFGRNSIVDFLIIWSGSAVVAALIGCFQARLLPRPLETVTWWRHHKDLIPGLSGDFAATSGLNKTTTYLVATIAGLTATASLRGANILLGPVNVMFQGIPPVALPEAARLRSQSASVLQKSMIALSASLSATAVACGLGILALPESVGRTLLHDTWEPARRVVFVLALALAASAANTGAIIGLRALGEANRLFRTRLIASSMIMVSVVIGATLGGAVGAAAGNAIGTTPATVLWWCQFNLALKRYWATTTDQTKDELSRVVLPEADVG